MDTKKKDYSIFQRFMLGVEKVGNKIPHPMTVFILLIVILFVVSHFTQGKIIEVPGSDKEVITQSLMTKEFMHQFLKTIPKNFTDFAALRYVLVIMLGTAMCEYTGLFKAAMGRVVSKASARMVTLIIVTISVNGNLALDSANVFIPALAAIAYAAIGRNPLIGIATSFSCISGAFCAAFIFDSNDAALAGITELATKMLPMIEGYEVSVAMNWYFQLIGALVLIPVGVFIDEKIVTPMVEGNPRYALDSEFKLESVKMDELSSTEKKGLRNAGISLLAYIIIVLVLTIPQNSFFRNPETGGIMPNSPFMDSMVVLLTLLFFIPGVTYGISIGDIKSEKDIANHMAKGIASMSSFVILIFFAAQFFACFNYTNLATAIAVGGTNLINEFNLVGIPLVIIYILIMTFINLFVVSSTSKWAMVAPIFVPMFALLGYSPAFAQALYRVGNSVSNIITPLSSGLTIVLGIMTRYKKDAGLGTIISLTLPFSIGLLITWTLLSVAFLVFQIPLGPGYGIFL
ncbi:MAG: AbgT family transporter [Tissierellia bacterium]|nr:AbgT family transporter [Tissierellia bacterium]